MKERFKKECIYAVRSAVAYNCFKVFMFINEV